MLRGVNAYSFVSVELFRSSTADVRMFGQVLHVLLCVAEHPQVIC